ncbi:hypothetical protein ABVK25_008230 [Lepraria finkii]|uniref:ABC1 atypical kinase-like domain-containing protein n=1 Tax=Lepraria finkii TaxID=1340010 RepID=A0ABR4B0Z3_9LECA
MRVLKPVAEASKTGSWICNRCLRGLRKSPFQCATYATRPTTTSTAKSFVSKAFRNKSTKAKATISKKPLAKPPSAHSPTSKNASANRKNLAIILAALLGAGFFLAFSDGARHSYAAATRSMRVLYALGRSVRDYQIILKDNAEDGDEWKAVLKACHKRCAERTLKAMEANGSIFIKLGQHLSSMNYLLPEEWTTTFIPLQDRCPVSSYESIADMVLRDTGIPIEEHFDEFEKVPIGAASLAQVHLATIKDTGRKVAVKVQHPALEEWIPLDLSLTKFTFSTLKRFFPEYDLEWLSSEMEVSLPQELDFTLEGEKMHYVHGSTS